MASNDIDWGKGVDIVAGKRYLYRTIFGNVYHVNVLKAGKHRSLCRWSVNSDISGYYDKVGFKSNWHFMEDFLS